MHLAAHYGNTRVIRRLLMHGANRHKKNAKNETPLKISQDSDFKNISKMLNDQYSFMDHFRFYFNVQIKYEPQNRSFLMPILFVLSTVMVISTVHVLLKGNFEGMPPDYYYLAPLGMFYIAFYAVYFFLLVAPKGLPKGKNY
jgi:ankyrin repeat protein